ncbi:hypothetical protein [Cytobacillus massiliigabonensis]|uniref:hypothetical protein n=1 Tax=Cytobacillus massiliigabonensis TaxID=1871011 RepID=UPI0015E0650B|nr:hypothetical protein [Cytobacillus massiliigabonensis]
MPATKNELIQAALLYYQAYQQDLPILDYRKQDVEYIIQQLNIKLTEGKEPFADTLVH